MSLDISGFLNARFALRARCLLMLCASAALLAGFSPPTRAYGATTLLKPPNNLGLVGYWSFEDGSGTKATDFSGNRNAGTLVDDGSGAPQWVDGKRGKALNFYDGVDLLGHVDAGNPAVLNVSSAGTVSAWFKQTGSCSSSLCTVVGNYNWTTDTNGYALEAGGALGVVAATFADASGIASHVGDTAFSLNTWHLGTITWDGSTVRVYLDGVVDSAPAAQTVVPSPGVNNLYIGDTPNGGLNFPGKIDEVRIYSRALGASEVAILYRSGAVKANTSSANLQQGSSLASGLVGLWTFDGSDLTDKVYDRSGQNNNGYFNGGATSSAKVIGKVGQGLRFDGVNDNVTISGSGGVADNLSAMSVSAWYKTGGSVGNMIIASKTNNSTAAGWLFGMNSLGLVNFYTGTDISNYHGRVTALGTETDNDSWHHVVATLTGGGSGTITIYIDGVPQTLVTDDSGTVTSYSSPHNIWIGDIADSLPWNGRLDDVRIYNRALSPAEIQQLSKLGTVIIRQ